MIGRYRVSYIVKDKPEPSNVAFKNVSSENMADANEMVLGMSDVQEVVEVEKFSLTERETMTEIVKAKPVPFPRTEEIFVIEKRKFIKDGGGSIRLVFSTYGDWSAFQELEHLREDNKDESVTYEIIKFVRPKTKTSININTIPTYPEDRVIKKGGG